MKIDFRQRAGKTVFSTIGRNQDAWTPFSTTHGRRDLNAGNCSLNV